MPGACATILKAAFDGSVAFNTLGDQRIVTASVDGLSLVDYTGADASQITVNNDTEKLASNIGQARDFSGIHWRSDYEWGLRLGEAAALSVLRDQSNNYAGRISKGSRSPPSTGKRSRSDLRRRAHRPAATVPDSQTETPLARSGLTRMSSGLRCL